MNRPRPSAQRKRPQGPQNSSGGTISDQPRPHQPGQQTGEPEAGGTNTPQSRANHVTDRATPANKKD